MIYSINESTGIKKNYTNISSILFECEQNNMMCFEAALACDFHEIKGINEGSILESELAALQEKSMEEYKNSILTAVRRCCEKLLSLLQSAMKTIGLWLIKTGTPLAQRAKDAYNMYMKTHGKVEPKFDITCNWIYAKKLEKYSVDDGITFAKAEDEIRAAANASEKQDAHTIASGVMSDMLGKKVESRGEFVAEALKDLSEERKVTCFNGKSGVLDMLTLLSDKEALTRIRTVEAELRTKLKGIEKEIKGISQTNAANISAIASGYQVVLSSLVDINIKATKQNMREANNVAHKVILAMEGTKNEAFEMLVAESEFDQDTDPVINTEVDPEYEEPVDALLSSVEPETACSDK